MLTNIYYYIKPVIPRRIQIEMRRRMVIKKRLSCKHIWPIDEKASNPPEWFLGWPEQKQFALVLTHDIDTEKGQEKCQQLMKMEEDLGFLSSFNFVPERYSVSKELRDYLASKGFEVGVHGLNHDGKLYKSKNIFKERAIRINQYLKEWDAVGFRSPAMHHNMNWIKYLDIGYDASTFDTDPFEPQSDGMRTIFPFWVGEDSNKGGYVELPYTLPQDFTLFILLREKNSTIWKKKLDWIVEKGGMVLMNTHPDYMNFDGKKLCIEEYPVQYYKEFLKYIKSKYEGQYWHVLPKDMAGFCSKNYKN
jgi:hypothetical protein